MQINTNDFFPTDSKTFEKPMSRTFFIAARQNILNLNESARFFYKFFSSIQNSTEFFK